MSDASTTIVARVVFPVTDADATMALYIDSGAEDATVRARGSVRLAPLGAISLGSYFNAFPAAYWQAETGATVVHLAVRTQGPGRVSILRSNERAEARVVDQRDVGADAVSRFELPLSGFAEGGVYWFDLAAGSGELLLHSAEWAVSATAVAEHTATVAMATFNRPSDCLAQLAVLSQDPRIHEVVDRIIVIDQGSDRLNAQGGFPEIAAVLGDRLEVLEQRNLGGSGGFSRGMLEALREGVSDSVLLLDDDAISEPEAIFRAIRFAGAARSPVIVGGGMFHIDARNVLYSQSEQWDRRIGWVHLDRPGAYNHDFAAIPFREAPFFHALHHADFNGWWMCLLPLALLREAGLSMPLFLKGDDMEFGLRAAEYGVRTLSIPGIALWHMGWGGKAPTRTWEAYFLHRNRLITELVHSRRRRPSRVIAHSFLGDVKQLLTMQYSAVRLRAQAISDVLVGPEPLPGWLPTRAAQIRALWTEFDDAIAVPAEVTDNARVIACPEPRGRRAQLFALLRVLARHFLRAERADHTVVRIGAMDLGWWTFASRDAALVDMADGRGAALFRRDRARTWAALLRAARLHFRLWWRWPILARDFRRARVSLTSPQSWSELFES